MNSCNFKNNSTKVETEIARKDTVGEYVYNIMDTVSTLYIHYDEYTGAADAVVDSGTLYLPENVLNKIKVLYSQKGDGFIPNGNDIYLTGLKNIKSIMFGDSSNYWLHWHDRFKITGRAVDIMHTESGFEGILFKVESYKYIETID